MSPWDLEQVDESRLPNELREGIPITPEEQRAFYIPKEHEWPPHGKDVECARISSGLTRIMEFAHAEDFAVPVDLNELPVYGIVIAYPMDLSTIKSRVENHFYRRLEAIRYDVQFIGSNAQEFNEAGTEIVKKAKMITELCLRFINDETCEDPLPLYQDILDHEEEFEGGEENYEVSESEEDYLSREPSREGLRQIRKRKVRMK